MRRLVVVALMALLGACGGGGGGGSSGGPKVTFNVSTTALSSNADSPSSPIPATQNLVGTVTGDVSSLSGTLYVRVEVSGPAVTDVPVSIDTERANGTGAVTVGDPKLLGAGTHQSTLTVRACLNDATCATGQLNGSPRTVNVTYTIGTSIQRDGVYPPVVASGSAGSVTIRRASIGTTVSNVTFGGTPATSFTQVSDTEVQVSYPALTAGAKTIAINGTALPISLSVADVPAFSAVTLPYPTDRQELGSVVYDAERQRLLVVNINGQSFDQSINRLLVYDFDGSQWSAPTSVTIDRLRAVALDGSILLAVRQYWLEERSASDFSLVRSITTPVIDGMEFMNKIAAANDGNFVIIQDYHGTGPTQPLIYSPSKHTIVTLARNWNFLGSIAAGEPGASADGSRIVVPAASYDTHVREYRPTTGVLATLSLDFSTAYSRKPAALDRRGTRIVLGSTTQNNVYDSNYSLLGTLPASTLAMVVNSVGTRAYTYDQDGTIRKFDISASANGGPFNEIGTGVPIGVVAPYPTWPIGMILTPDDGTAIVAGSQAVAIQPVTP